MRKKELYNLNAELFQKSQKYMALYEEQKKENEKLIEEINRLKSENEVLGAKAVHSKPLENLEDKLKFQAKFSEEANMGATTIGKIVVKAAASCNALTSANDNYDPKELVNLILGRTEVAKAEILKVVESDMPLESKLSLIENVKNSAMDYIDSVMAQKE